MDGASGSENVYYLDGMNVTGIQNGTLDTQNRVPVEMVQQVEVKNGVMEAQYGGAMGGVVNAVLRSGTNQFHGEGGVYFDNSSMQGRRRGTLELDPNDPNTNTAHYIVYCGFGGSCQYQGDKFRNWQPIFNLGGPLIPNKLFFFSAYSPVLNSTTRHVNFQSGESADYDRTTRWQYLSNKLEFIPTQTVRMNVSWLWNPVRNTGSLPNVNGQDAYDSPWADLGDRTSGNVVMGQVDYLPTPRLIFSFRGGYYYNNNNNNYGVPLRTALYYSQSNTDSAQFPNIPDSLRHSVGWLIQALGLTQFNSYARQNYDASFSYMFNAGGQHNIKGGWAINKLSNDIFSSSYPGGYYRYYWSSTTQPMVYHCVTSQCTTGSGAFGYYRYRVLGTIGGASSNNQGLFLLDNWRVNKRLTLNLGLRSEREFVPSFSADPTLPKQAITFGWGQKLSPRIGGAFDLKGDGKQKIYASFGIFYDVMKYELPRGSFGGDVWKEYYYTLDDPNVVSQNNAFATDPTHLPGTFLEMVDWRIPSNDPNNTAAQVFGQGSLVDPNLKPMQMRMFDLGYEYSFGSNLVASARYTNRRLVRTIEDTGFMSPDGEAYMIANPGEGRTANATLWASIWEPGVPMPPKPVRKYDGLELRLDKRFSRNYQLAFSYTYSRLRGNYSGLASSDEASVGGDGSLNGRASPDVNRYYDEPWVGVKENGQYAFGNLATDRPHTFKVFGYYSLRSKLGATSFSPIIAAYSGTPMTTEVPVISSTPAFPFGRGDMGRTPFFFNTDFSIAHEFGVSKNNEAMKLKFQFLAYNLFNGSTVLDKYKTISHQLDGYLQFDAYADVFKGFDTRAMMAEQQIRQDPEYNMPTAFQSPRSLRLRLSFTF